jgi:GNAT superfamily N-acetyltransferase
MNIIFNHSDLLIIESLRNQYFDELPEVQEYYVEQLIKTSGVFNILEDKKGIGYVIIHPDRTLLEYYLVEEVRRDYFEIFKQVLSAFSIERVLCKSFDEKLLDVSLKCCRFMKKDGILFREFNGTELMNDSLKIRNAVEEDIDTIEEISEGIFENRDEICLYVFSDQLKVFEQDGNLTGIGIITKVLNDKLYYDIGTAVRKEYRGKGIGSYIINYLYYYMKSLGCVPLAACGYDNAASKRALEKAGFVATHELLEFQIK